MCACHESTWNGFGDIWWTDNPIYFSSIDIQAWMTYLRKGIDMLDKYKEEQLRRNIEECGVTTLEIRRLRGEVKYKFLRY